MSLYCTFQFMRLTPESRRMVTRFYNLKILAAVIKALISFFDKNEEGGT